MKRQRDAECPHCGAVFRAGRLACPECGSDAKTGWQEQEEIDYQALDLEVPGYGDAPPSRPGSTRARVIVALIVAAMIVTLLIAFGRA